MNRFWLQCIITVEFVESEAVCFIAGRMNLVLSESIKPTIDSNEYYIVQSVYDSVYPMSFV